MTEKSMLWTAAAGTGDGAATYTEAETTRLFRRLVTGGDNEGVLRDPDEEFGAAGSNELEVSGTSSPVQVEAGDAWCHGYYYWNTAQEDVAIASPVGATRIDRIVLRVDFSADTVRITLVAGTEGSGSPPSLTQNATYWDIPLAQASITTGGVITITDEREYCHFNGMITTAGLDDDAVTNDKLRNSGACSIIGRAANSAGGPADISAAANDRVLGRTSDTLSFLQITNGMLGNDIVDDTKVGNRVPQFYRRQGGNATNWVTPGTTTYTPTTVRMQAGSIEISLSAANESSELITFPTAFSQTPIVIVSLIYGGSYNLVQISASTTDATQTQIYLGTVDGSSITEDFGVLWLAIGAE